MPALPQTPGRSPAIQNPVQALDASAIDAQEVAEYVFKAISAGSQLPNPSAEVLQAIRVTRRALIVAPIYINDPNWPGLNSTATDVMLVHKMLVRCGYEERNIRVLCDICGGFLGLADPTRENIFSSLDWLTSNTQAGDYRFFHFSGHGERILQEKDISQAKQARRVRTGYEPAFPGDYERYLSIREPKRITEQTIPEKELAYYNQAIATRYCEPRYGGSKECSSKIMDSELNEYLSKLPPGSFLTCIMDCCASGRITNSNTKIRGGGFRGRINKSMLMNPHEVVQSPTKEEHPELAATPGPSTMVQAATRTFSGMVSTVTSLVNPALVTMTEDIPEQERQMDRIQARTFVWTGCHQRQEAFDHMEYNSGLLTRVFAKTFETHFDGLMAGTMDYDTLFCKVSGEVNAQSFATSTLQFVQLWTSLQDTDEDQVDVLLKSPVVI